MSAYSRLANSSIVNLTPAAGEDHIVYRMIDAADIGRVNDVRLAIITLFTSCTVIDTYCGRIIVSGI